MMQSQNYIYPLFGELGISEHTVCQNPQHPGSATGDYSHILTSQT